MILRRRSRETTPTAPVAEKATVGWRFEDTYARLPEALSTLPPSTALGTLLAALTIYEQLTGEIPIPSIADALYIGGYLLLAAGVLWLALQLGEFPWIPLVLATSFGL